VTKEGVASIFEIEYVIACGIAKFKQGKILTKAAMQASSEWDYFDGNGWFAGHVDQLLYLPCPYSFIPHDALDYSFIKDEMQPRRVSLFEKLLPRHADLESSLDGLGGKVPFVL